MPRSPEPADCTLHLANHLACLHLMQLAAAVERGEIPPPPERENPHAELSEPEADASVRLQLAGLLQISH